ncbi:MAG: ATP-binding protein, partial [Akkermansiaceae bacterium]|nr:ATP-binding protein [Xanthomonadales bacterium]NIP94541.1 ATP-binding protein [Akkermansiaceae bacterium]NIX12839.1 AAA family ATPase [Xanthomonadales bacterium]
MERVQGVLKGDGGSPVLFVTGDPGSGKSALLQALARRASDDEPELLVAFGACNAFTGTGDPYLPFRDAL